LFPEQCR
jgi:hypothetical protein